MKTLKTPFTLDFKHYGKITVPIGTQTNNATACGIDPDYNFVSSFEWIKKDYPSIEAILLHDAKYYGINVPVEYLND